MTLSRSTRFSRSLGLVALAPIALGLAMIAAVVPAHAQEVTEQTYVRRSANPVVMRHRIEAAALKVCGADEDALAEVRVAVRASPCWQQAVSEAIASLERGPRQASLPRPHG